MQRLNVRALQPGASDDLVLVTRSGDAVWMPLEDLSPGDGGPLSIDDLRDVDTTSDPPSGGQALLWDAGVAQWVPGTVVFVVPESVDDLDDVDTTTVAPEVGESLVWDGTNWVPGLPVYPTILVPLTTEVGGDPQLVWDDDGQLVMTEVPL